MLKIFTKYHLDHVIGFLLIFSVVTIGSLNLGKGRITIYHASALGVSYVIGTALPFYLSRNYLVPQFLYKKKNWQFFLGICAAILTAACLLYLTAWVMLTDRSAVVRKEFFNPVSILFNVLLFVAFPSITATAFFVLGDQIKTKIEYEKTLKEKKQAELEYLKSQINPHFIFNAINTMYFQVDESVQGAKKTMVQFSEMLRYQLYECSVDYIEIEKEIAYLKNFMSLQLLRKESNYHADFIHDGVGNFKIAPLLLIPLVENAFKYLSNYDEKSNKVMIEMFQQPRIFSVTITNTKEDKTDTIMPDNSGGIGLSNVRKRLALLYPERHRLIIEETADLFTLTLQLTYE